MSVSEHPTGSLRTGNVSDELARGQVNLDVTVVSPARQIFSGPAHWVTVPGVDGQLGIWPRHAALVSALGSGPLRIGQRGGEVRRFAIRGGFLDVAHNVVTILVDSALAEAEIDPAEARRDLDETNAALVRRMTDERFAQLLDDRDWAQTRLKMAR